MRRGLKQELCPSPGRLGRTASRLKSILEVSRKSPKSCVLAALTEKLYKGFLLFFSAGQWDVYLLLFIIFLGGRGRHQKKPSNFQWWKLIQVLRFRRPEHLLFTRGPMPQYFFEPQVLAGWKWQRVGHFNLTNPLRLCMQSRVGHVESCEQKMLHPFPPSKLKGMRGIHWATSAGMIEKENTQKPSHKKKQKPIELRWECLSNKPIATADLLCSSFDKKLALFL